MSMWLTCCTVRISYATFVPSNSRVAAICRTIWPRTSRKCGKCNAKSATNGWRTNCVCASTCCNIPPYGTSAHRAIIRRWINNACAITFASITPMANRLAATCAANRSNWKTRCSITWCSTRESGSSPVHFAPGHSHRAATITRIENECIHRNWRPCNWSRRKMKGNTGAHSPPNQTSILTRFSHFWIYRKLREDPTLVLQWADSRWIFAVCRSEWKIESSLKSVMVWEPGTGDWETSELNTLCESIRISDGMTEWLKNVQINFNLFYSKWSRRRSFYFI